MITALCRFLSVPCSSYYNWRQGLERKDRDAALIETIRKGQKISRGTYGYRRMTIWLNDTLGITVNSKRVRRVMKKAGLQSKIRRGKKFKVMDGTTYKYDNILNRDFHAERPNEKFVTDITYIKTDSGMVFLSMIKDLFDNSISGYSISRNNDLKLVSDNIINVFERIETQNGSAVMLHSDQGFQYTSRLYARLIEKYNIKASMSRKGNCFDNAGAENFFSHLKAELIKRVRLRDYREAKKAIDEYIWYYNNERIQIKLKMAPMKYLSRFWCSKE